MAEPTEYTDVIDAFDEGDPFDLNFSLAYRRTAVRSVIEREVAGPDSADARADSRLVEVARGDHVENTLWVGLQFGLYRDLSVSVRVPLVLSDARELTPPTGLDAAGEQQVRDALAAPTPGASDPEAPDQFVLEPGTTLTSKTRSGVPAVHLGLSWGITNQYRRAHLPTWVLRVRTEVGTGNVLAPCLEGSGCDPGISRGTLVLDAESSWSYRFRYVEPFAGVGYRGEWATAAADAFEPGGDLAGYVDTGMPQRGRVELGLAVIPWEHRMRFQRLSIVGSFQAQYVGSGRDYTPLFDALGASPSPYLGTPNFDSTDPSDPDRTEVPFTGVTNTEAHGRFGFKTVISMRAARYVHFGLGLGVDYATPHLITGADACNGGVDVGAGDPRSGSCSQGILNPLHRPAIDLPGTRFRLGGAVATSLFATATGQF